MFNISKHDIYNSFKVDNPWWADESFNFHQLYPIRRDYFPAFKLLSLNLDIQRSVILMGPRRVGKTVMLKQLIDTAISHNIEKTQIFFTSVDTPLYSDLRLDQFIDVLVTEGEFDTQKPGLIIFDEIQYLKDWERHLKVLTDKFPRIKFIASGSAAAALKLKSQESGAGRFTEFFLPPLTFAEFLKFNNQEETLITSSYDPAEDQYEYKTPDIDALNRAFVEYLNYGGWPEAVLNQEIQKNAQRYLGRDIVDKVLLRDLPSLYGIQDIQELNRLFMTVAYNSGLEMSLEALSQKSGVAKNTLNRYLTYLEASFLIIRINRVDGDGKRFQRQTKFKVYLTNPSMRTALFTPVSAEDDVIGSLVETAIFSQWTHMGEMEHFFYGRWKEGQKDLEIDLISKDKDLVSTNWICEIKWSDRFVKHPEELSGLIAFSKKNQMRDNAFSTTRRLSDHTYSNGVLIEFIPSALYCYILGKNILRNQPLNQMHLKI